MSSQRAYSLVNMFETTVQPMLTVLAGILFQLLLPLILVGLLTLDESAVTWYVLTVSSI